MGFRLKPTPSSLWPLLGGIRFFLALVVVAAHMGGFRAVGAPIEPLAEALFSFNATGAVYGFFVLSGYSIAASWAKQSDAFYFRRALRILPLYFLIVVSSAIIPGLFGGVVTNRAQSFTTPTLWELVGNLCFAQGFFAKPINTDLVVWSLSIEVFFYALTPWFAKLSTRAIGWLIAVHAAVFYMVTNILGGLPASVLGSQVGLLAWAWLLGFWLHRRESDRFSLAAAFVLGAAATPLLGVKFPILWAAVLLAIAYGDRVKIGGLVRRLLTTLGDASYPLYLVHIPTFTLLYALGYRADNRFFLAAIGTSIALDLAFDQPFKRLVVSIYESRPNVPRPVGVSK